MIYVWGNLIYRLSQFIDYDLFTIADLEKTNSINVQHTFKRWHSITYGYDEQLNDQVWQLQLAICNRYNEYLNNTQNSCAWSRFLIKFNHNEINSKFSSMTHDACCECLAITKLAYTILKF